MLTRNIEVPAWFGPQHKNWLYTQQYLVPRTSLGASVPNKMLCGLVNTARRLMLRNYYCYVCWKFLPTFTRLQHPQRKKKIYASCFVHYSYDLGKCYTRIDNGNPTTILPTDSFHSRVVVRQAGPTYVHVVGIDHRRRSIQQHFCLVHRRRHSLQRRADARVVCQGLLVHAEDPAHL